MTPDQFPTTERTRMRRRAKRATYDVDTVYAIFDETLTSSVAVATSVEMTFSRIPCRLPVGS